MHMECYELTSLSVLASLSRFKAIRSRIIADNGLQNVVNVYEMLRGRLFLSVLSSWCVDKLNDHNVLESSLEKAIKQ